MICFALIVDEGCEKRKPLSSKSNAERPRMLCSNCHSEIGVGKRFCPKCGARLLDQLTPEKTKPTTTSKRAQVGQVRPAREHHKSLMIGTIIFLSSATVALFLIGRDTAWHRLARSWPLGKPSAQLLQPTAPIVKIPPSVVFRGDPTDPQSAASSIGQVPSTATALKSATKPTQKTHHVARAQTFQLMEIRPPIQMQVIQPAPMYRVEPVPQATLTYSVPKIATIPVESYQLEHESGVHYHPGTLYISQDSIRWEESGQGAHPEDNFSVSCAEIRKAGKAGGFMGLDPFFTIHLAHRSYNFPAPNHDGSYVKILTSAVSRACGK